jgi:hypothetical protein
MGLFDRLLGKRSSFSVQGDAAKPAKKQEAYYLDPDSSSSLGDVDFMRRANTIRHTFPGNADSPGEKEMVQQVGSMEARLEKSTPGLAGPAATPSTAGGGSAGVASTVKKSFAKQMSPAELEQRLKGAAVKGVNEPAEAGSRRTSGAGTDQPAITQQSAKPGDPDTFRAWAKDLNA